MNKVVHIIFFAFTAGLLTFFACSKSKTTEPVNVVPFPAEIKLNNCLNGPDYGSQVICLQWRGPNQDHKVKPKNNPGAGKYYSWPKGLVINENTGEINVSQSETGARYIIGFVKTGTQDTCLSEIILGGVTYIDSVYVLENNDSLATPYYNASPVPGNICDASDDSDYPGNGSSPGGNDKCEFDDGPDDDNGNGPFDEPPAGKSANAQKVRVRTKNGVINLKKTLEEGAFGANPQNGDTKQVTIYYRLNDCSAKALHKINVNLIYYEKKSDIPAALLNDVRHKRENFMSARIIEYYEKPRPPQIIITRYY